MPSHFRKVTYRSLAFIGFLGYRVGNDGCVWSKMTHKSAGMGRGSISEIGDKWVQLALTSRPDGRLAITLHRAGYVKTFTVHRLILLAFVGPCPEGMEACHNDGNASNNNLANLRWDTHINNEKDKVLHGTNVGSRGNNKGELQGSAKLTDENVLEIRYLFASGKHTLLL